MTERVRLFVAVEVPPDVGRDVDAASAPLQRRAADAKWSEPGGWHLTLAFLGWVDAERKVAVEAACAAVAAGAAPFELRLTGAAGMFGRRVLWVGLEPSAALQALADRVQMALERAGFEREERAFHAHLTLARARRGRLLPGDLPDDYHARPAAWQVQRFVLMRSQLHRSGARYTVEAAWQLLG
jgi:RNA 2',3'-cyclic 3'-phosphodiesterase